MTGYSERRDAAYEATLAAIDDATERRCSQCHSPLAEDSTSEWFCAPTEDTDCQWSWHQAHAANPRDVYNRTDAGHQIDLEQLLHTPGRIWLSPDPDFMAEMEARIQEALDRSHAEGVMRSGGPDVERTEGTAFAPRGMSPLEWCNARSPEDRERIAVLLGPNRIVVTEDSGWQDVWPTDHDGTAEFRRVWLDEMRGAEPVLTVQDELHATAQAIGEFVGVPVSESSDLPEGIALRYTDERGIEVPPAHGHHRTHCQHEAECCRCRGHDECVHVRISPSSYDSWADLRAAWRRATNSGET